MAKYGSSFNQDMVQEGLQRFAEAKGVEACVLIMHSSSGACALVSDEALLESDLNVLEQFDNLSSAIGFLQY